MSNSYNTGQHWNQNPIDFGSLQLEELESASGNGRQPQHMLQQAYPAADSYRYSQQQFPPAPHSSSLHGAFNAPQIQQQSHTRPSSFGPSQSSQNSANTGYVHGVYGSQNNSPAVSSVPLVPYRTNPTTFNFSGTPSSASLPSMDTSHVGGVPPNFASPAPLHDSFSAPSTSARQQSYYHPRKQEDLSGSPQAKRHHSLAFREETTDDADAEHKDGKAKLSRACARCKNLKVRCEAKTETEPCKRCFNGGHDCVIPGRKIRRTPPKREHLIGEIQRQAEEIDRLMGELQKVSPKHGQRDNYASLHSPVLLPSPTSGSYLVSDLHSSADDNDLANTDENSSNSNKTTMNKAVEDWIAKARESLQEFGAFIHIGGAGMPKSYLVDEDPEGDSDEEEEYVDVQEEFEGFGIQDDHYDVSVEQSDSEDLTRQHNRNDSAGGAGLQPLNHKLSNSSIGTAATAGTGTNTMRRKHNENARPANLPVEASPFGLFGNLALKESRTERDEEDKGSGIASADFFKPTPAPRALGHRLEIAQHQPPAILTRGIISPQEAEKLFEIYFNNMNLSVSLLDPVLYTAQRTFYRSPFLFTVICAIASRFYSERPDLYVKCMHYAQLAAGTALIAGNKNVEMCSAYILLSLYPVPAKKWEDQRSWLYLGLAIRTATDLNLHLPTTAKPQNENHAREMLNRTRVWMNCLNLDRSTGSQYGKPPIISPKDYIANHSENWWTSSPYNMKNFDVHICAYSSELKVMAAFIAKIYSDPDHPTGLNKDVDFEKIATDTDDELQALRDKWFSVIAETDLSDPQNSFRTGLLRLAYSYSRLIALSYGFQHAFGKNDGIDENPFLMRCLRAAEDVVDAVVNDICRPGQLHYMRHGPEAQSVFVTFASAFLVKLLQPRFASYLKPEIRVEIRTLVKKVIDLLGSPAVAIDERHGPKLYSRFLEKLLARPMAKIDPMSPGSAANPAFSPPIRGMPRMPKQNFDFPAGSFDLPTTDNNHSSPSTTTSLSPPPAESALSFDNFAPMGPTDPFARETAAVSSAINMVDGTNIGNMMATDFFQPAFDEDILRSIQSLTDPSGWQDLSLPGFNWMTQFQQNLGLDLTSDLLYDQNMEYMTGPGNGDI